MLHLWNTLHRKLEPFTPIEEGKVGMYTCGLTVYDRGHIGNLRCFLFEDVLHRTLLFLGYSVKHVMNITDVGHLVSDGDEGEDKMEKGSRRTGKTAWEIAREYEDWFLKDIKAVGMLMPDALPRATDHIQEQIEIVKVLEEKGFAYKTSDGMYFDTAKFPDYGKLSGQKLSEKEAGARVEVNEEKRNPTDFALWKFTPAGVKWQMEWESPWGKGCPGWHIECSAMAAKYLGQPFDIHCGGVDHIPVHHENEIAQSEAAYDKALANYWLHSEFITVDGQKMSKSLGNGYTLQDITDRGFDPVAYRYFCLGAHYRSKINFTWEALEGAQNALRKIQRWVVDYKKTQAENQGAPNEAVLAEFRSAIAEDLNTPKALALVHGLLRMPPSDAEAPTAYSTMREMDRVLGLGVEDWLPSNEVIPAEIQALSEARLAARASKQWAESDRLRDELKAKGWLVEDSATGSSLRKL